MYSFAIQDKVFAIRFGVTAEASAVAELFCNHEVIRPYFTVAMPGDQTAFRCIDPVTQSMRDARRLMGPKFTQLSAEVKMLDDSGRRSNLSVVLDASEEELVKQAMLKPGKTDPLTAGVNALHVVLPAAAERWCANWQSNSLAQDCVDGVSDIFMSNARIWCLQYESFNELARGTFVVIDLHV